MASEPVYYIVVEGAERGPYPLPVLRDVWKRGLVKLDVQCRAPDATATTPLGQILGIAAPPPVKTEPKASDQGAVLWLPNTSPAANPEVSDTEEEAPSSRVVAALVTVNIAVFVAFGAMGGGFMDADSEALVRWGSNYGPYTAEGQWWRLLTAAFLHGGLTHLVVNMYALIDVGRLCERSFGAWRFAVLYLLSGVLGSAVSLWWNPGVNSVGASGAVFGVFGATLVYVLDSRNGVPFDEVKSHSVSLLVLIGYSLLYGFSHTGIDNAAHIGGLVGGVVMGFALSRPAESIGEREGFPVRAVIGTALCVFAIVGLAALAPSRVDNNAEQRFLSDMKWFGTVEKNVIIDTRDIVEKMNANSLSPTELRSRVTHVVEQWDGARQRFLGYELDSGSKLREAHQTLLEYAEIRYQAASAMLHAVQHPEDQAAAQEVTRLVGEGNAMAQRFTRIANTFRDQAKP